MNCKFPWRFRASSFVIDFCMAISLKNVYDVVVNLKDRMNDLMKFRELGLSENSLGALREKGFEEPTEVQKKCIPLLLQNTADVVGQAQTGTGKTAAFGLPIIELINPDSRNVQALILTPTRELAIQVAEEISSLMGKRRIKIATIYGGQSYKLQLDRLREGVQIVVGTPGRVIDHIGRGRLLLDNLDFFILDEADEMLNMGFIDDVEKILESTKKKKRMLFFSATMPQRILSLASKYMPGFKHVEIKREPLTTSLTDQIYFEVRDADKFESLCRIIDVEEDFYGLIFCRTKIDVDNISHKLQDRGYLVDAIHGDIEQKKRESIIKRFKDKKVQILIATDVAARGLDVNDLTHVINYALPQDAECYTHRIGRTGRAGKQGTAVTFITPSEFRKLAYIKRTNNVDIRKEKVPEIKDIIRIRKNRLFNNLSEIIEKGQDEIYKNFASEVLKNFPPSDVVAALLKQAFGKVLDEKSYAEIKNAPPNPNPNHASVDRQGVTRLFIARGKRDGLSKRDLVEFIFKKSGVQSKYIDDVEVFDTYSFVSVPFKEAEVILNTFHNSEGRDRSLVVKAKKGKSF